MKKGNSIEEIFNSVLRDQNIFAGSILQIELNISVQAASLTESISALGVT